MPRKFQLFTLYGSVIAFAIYWLFTIVYTCTIIKSNTDKKYFGEAFFSQDWSLFTPPRQYYLRLYFISMDSLLSNKMDTIEILQNLSAQKKNKAPFNQREDIITQMLYADLYKIYPLTQEKIAQLKKRVPDSTENYYAMMATAQVLKNKSSNKYFFTLRNYAKQLYKDKGINTQHKQVKIIAATKQMIPYHFPSEQVFVPQETLFFQTGFFPIQ